MMTMKTSTYDDKLLRYVSLESHSSCNQACYFCPVSVAPRKPVVMDMNLYRNIIEQLANYRSTLDAVFMNQYNEPSIDKHFIQQVDLIKQHGLVPAVLSNGSGLTPRKVEQLLKVGGLGLLTINLSTLDQQQYIEDRGKNHLTQVIKNIDYMQNKRVAGIMKIVVLGQDDLIHESNYRAIKEKYKDSLFEVEQHTASDRAHYFDNENGGQLHHKSLRGCEQMGSRTLNHLHITAEGKCVICCQDYDEKYVIGNLTSQSVADVLHSEKFEQIRRWTDGVDEAPDDYICRKCSFAKTGEQP
ncbi:radical SAM/SPASM domain-containing protein [Algibacillus agarilyticus]|uniref:radical SAM/SPASM domain-containing protein n=1 Tax=Algibacillus agarilyticus TaxID=2234133 RepID=UPI000DD0DBA1|nr:radical SAM/SPASM domain-containing protein [Algibacillus agarilyticus]